MWKDIFLYSNSSIFFLLMIFIQQFADNEDLQLEWIEAKRRNKIRVAETDPSSRSHPICFILEFLRPQLSKVMIKKFDEHFIFLDVNAEIPRK